MFFTLIIGRSYSFVFLAPNVIFGDNIINPNKIFFQLSCVKDTFSSLEEDSSDKRTLVFSLN